MGSYKLLFACVCFVVLWSSGWIGSKYGQEYAGAFTLLAYRYLLVTLVLLAFVSATKSWRSITPSQLALHILVGVLAHAVYLGSANSALVLGVSAGLVAFITALQPMVTATFSSSISGERTDHRQWSGLALGFAAVLLVISDKIALGSSMYAYSLPLIAVLALSMASLLDRRASLHKQKNKLGATPLSLVCLIHSSAALLVILPTAAYLEGFNAQWGGELVFSILWLAFAVSLGAYGMMFYMLRSIQAVKVSSLGYLAPPTTMLMAFLMFDERLTLVEICGIVLAGIAVKMIMSPKAKVSGSNENEFGDNPLLRPPAFKRQSFLTNRFETPASNISTITVDIELDDYSSPFYTSESIQNNRPIREPIQLNQDNIQTLILDKDQELQNLKLAWVKLEDSRQKIANLKQGLATNDHDHTFEEDEQELQFLQSRLTNLIQRQESRKRYGRTFSAHLNMTG